MPNHSAFISELYYQSNTGITEFIEVTLKASEDPADYTLSFYTHTGTMYAGSNAAGQVGGLLLLSDPNISVAQNTTDPDYNVYTILANLARLPVPIMTLVRLSTPIASVDRTCCSQKVLQQT